jgi:prolyl-tRNA editing enzyme YbaK/EbsC (Cys-tRNA(Pro) deacylase)
MPAWFDRDLLNWETVWAAAGTGDTLFGIAPRALLAATGATVVQVA